MNAKCLSTFFWIAIALQTSLAIPLPPIDINGLTSDNFDVREKAQAEILSWAREDRDIRTARLVGFLDGEDPEIEKRILEILRKLSDEDYLSDGQGYLGIMMGEEKVAANPNGKPGAGIRISKVMEGGPADLAGVREDDLIIALDGVSWDKPGAMNAFMEKIASMKPLTNVLLTIRRNAPALVDITVSLGKRPVADLRFTHENPQALDTQAKEEHFRQWLKILKPD